MQLSRFTDFSLRVLLYLAINNHKRARLQDIAEFYPLPLEHLRKVVHALAKAGYLQTFRGKHGGIELARNPELIRIGEVIQQFEGHSTLIDCEGLGCRLSPACALKRALKQGQNAFFTELNSFTLEDMVKKQPDMVRLLENHVA